jgi:hypothetical protein
VSDSVYKAGNERKWKISMVMGVGKTWSLNIKFSRKSLNFPDQFGLATPIANPTPQSNDKRKSLFKLTTTIIVKIFYFTSFTFSFLIFLLVLFNF